MSIPFLFLFPNISYTSNSVDFIYHYGAGFVGAALAKEGIDSIQYIDEQPRTLDELVERILQKSPQIVGFTCYETNGYLIDVISRALKKAKPNLITLVGGPAANFDDQYILSRYSSVDIVVRGEAEESIRELVPSLLDKSPWDSVRGISFRSGNKIRQNPMRPIDKEVYLDHLASPYLEGILPGEAGPSTGLSTSRGCRGVCAYCQFPAVFRFRFRQFSIERIIAEVKLLKRYLKPGGRLLFWDDDFATDRKRLKKLCNALITIGSVPFQAELRADHIDAELISLLAEAGMKQAHFGLESANPKTLRLVNRLNVSKLSDPDLATERHYLQSIKRAIYLMKSHGIRTSVSVIIGLPGESEADAENTLDYVEQLGVDNYQHNVFWALSGTRLRTWAEQGRWGLSLKHSDTPLKFFSTVHHFDIEKVARRDNATWGHKGKRLQKVLSGISKTEIAWQNRFRDLLIDDCYSPDGNFIEWVKKEAVLSSTFYLFHPQSSWYHTKMAMNKAYYKYGAAQVNYHAVRIINVDTKDWAPDQRSSHLIRLPYSRLVSDIITLPKSKVSMACVGITLDSVDDISALRQHSEMGDSGIDLPAWLLSLPFTIIDACRWLGVPRPCAALERLSVVNGQIHPCVNGPPLGALSNSIGYYRNTILEQFINVEKQRQCIKCSAIDCCPRCLATNSIGSDLYCTIQKTERKLLNWMSLLNRLSCISNKLNIVSSNDRFRCWTNLGPLWSMGCVPYDPNTLNHKLMRKNVLVIKDSGSGLVVISLEGNIWRFSEGSAQVFASMLNHPELSPLDAWHAADLGDIDPQIHEGCVKIINEMLGKLEFTTLTKIQQSREVDK